MCQWGVNRNTWAGYRMRSAGSVRTPNRGVIDRRTQIEHIMWGRRAAWPDHRCGDDLVDVAAQALKLNSRVSSRPVDRLQFLLCFIEILVFRRLK